MTTSIGVSGVTFPDSTLQTTAFTGSGSGGFPGFGTKIFTSSGTFTVPSGVTQIVVTVVGGGGAGYDSSSNPGSVGGGGGGGGGVIQGIIASLTAGNTITVTVGANHGGTSSFGTYLTASGGSNSYSNYGAGGGGSSASGATIVFQASGGGGGNGGTAGCCSQYPSGGGGGSVGIFAQAYNFSPYGNGGVGFYPYSPGNAGLVVVQW